MKTNSDMHKCASLINLDRLIQRCYRNFSRKLGYCRVCTCAVAISPKSTETLSSNRQNFNVYTKSMLLSTMVTTNDKYRMSNNPVYVHARREMSQWAHKAVIRCNRGNIIILYKKSWSRN